ncbi:MAG: PLP-dependent aminotransferase family protein [Clostridia bacterium]|nr:PLP-dependent aminotransferase family protein [Clostridia bacterium]
MDGQRSEKQYIRLYEDLRKGIETGLYPAGSKLPSKRTMARDNGVSLITAEHALQLLEDEGYIAPKERSGYFVIYDEDSTFPVDLGENKTRYWPQEDSDETGFPFSVYAKTARRVLTVYAEAVLQRSPNFGAVILREAIARYLAKARRIEASPEQIIIGSGAEYLYGLIVQVLGRSRIYGIEDPSYEKIAQVYRANDITCDPLPLGPDGIRSEALWGSDAQVLHITPYRSYPSGVTATNAKKREYMRWRAQRNAYIIEDDFESEITPARKPEETLFSMDDSGRVLYVNTFTNTISTAVRTAYLVVPEPLLKNFKERIGFYTCTVPTFEQYILAELILNGDFERHINRMRRAKRKTI